MIMITATRIASSAELVTIYRKREAGQRDSAAPTPAPGAGGHGAARCATARTRQRAASPTKKPIVREDYFYRADLS